jgi:hypothetical protein
MKLDCLEYAPEWRGKICINIFGKKISWKVATCRKTAAGVKDHVYWL